MKAEAGQGQWADGSCSFRAEEERRIQGSCDAGEEPGTVWFVLGILDDWLDRGRLVRRLVAYIQLQPTQPIWVCEAWPVLIEHKRTQNVLALYVTS